jgi:hypothetical protein
MRVHDNAICDEDDDGGWEMKMTQKRCHRIAFWQK